MSYMSSASSAIRVGGLASGIDTDSIVKKLMTAERIPLDKLNQNKQLLEWKRDSYREINSKLVDFRQNKLSLYKSSESLNAQKATVTGNTTAVTATATAGATGIAMSVTVNQLASKATTTGDALTTSDGKAKMSTNLSQLTNNTSATEYKLKVNDVEMTFQSTDSITSVLSTINSNSTAKVSATFDEITGKFSITSKEFGGTVNIDRDSTFANLAGMGTNNTNTVVTAAQQAKVNINGTDLTFDSNVNTINGVQLNFLATSGTSGESKISTQTDSSKVIETVKAFISSYNSMLSTMKSKTEETKYRDFAPLTTEQKKELSEDEVKTWNEKSMSGLLKGDDILKSAMQDMRNVITTALGSVGGVSLPDMGITTGTYSEGGKLYLDETKLKTAIEKNPQGIITTLQGSDSKSGVFNQLYNKLNDTIGKLADKAGTSRFNADVTATFSTKSSMAKELTDYNNRILALTNRLNDRETRYYKQFTSMESALSKLNSQSSSLTNYLSS
ncbi:flagellar filament capping protein FliD [Paenibacillus sp. KACC 21273]|uniref:flagellar filament capping protein FliD n=1 Tax=Paenibacillus sp. KACC 21273 TaxID=3025665 RepID=UPI0023654A5C|nr:flagellar filament capping protein FliD [Paenibacillus sp. KACC 21273]WDF51483.1 flagellar filament capping protein FliD [Paenibacillus sp. KACC 21273]